MGKGNGSGKGLKQDKLNNYLVNEGQKTIFNIIFAAVNFVVFFNTYAKYKTSNEYKLLFSELGEGLTFARGAAATLNLNCALLLIPVSRTFVTKLRGTFVGRLLPLDMNIRFHKVLAFLVAFAAAVHGLSHYFNYKNLARISEVKISPFSLAYGTIPGVTGHLIVLCMIFLYTTALERIRRHCFELFWYNHHLYVFFFGFLLIHGTVGLLQPNQFFLWFAFPGLLYSTERSLRVFRSNLDTTVRQLVQHPGKVIEIQLNKSTFKYKSGMYLFLNCQGVAPHEWHPFTITSAPEEDYVSVHVRVVGDWTEGVAELLGVSWDKNGVPQEQGQTGYAINTPFRIDGPFGAASEDVFDFEVALLVGAGIGVTPFASILKCCWYRVRELGQMRLRRVYFVWVCREQSSFEWFCDLLAALEAENLSHFLDIRIYLTAALKIEDVKDIMYLEEDGAPDALTGLQSPTYYGRPNFEAIFQELCQSHPNQTVGVFLCGPKAISRMLRTLSSKYTDARAGGTRFVYNKENF